MRHALTTLAAALVLFTAAAAQAGGDWNDSQVAWQTYDAGQRRAGQELSPGELAAPPRAPSRDVLFGAAAAASLPYSHRPTSARRSRFRT